MSVAALLAHPITVDEALHRREDGADDEELAVRGWASGPDAAFDCSLPPNVPAIFAACQNPYQWLAADRITRLVGPFSEPTGAAFHLVLQPGTSGPSLAALPEDVVVLGHFADHRAVGCRIEGEVDRRLCDRAFVVDALVRPNSSALDRLPFGEPLINPDLDARPSIGRADAIVAAGVEPTSDRLLIAFAMRRSLIEEAEPAAASLPPDMAVDTFWIVRFLEGDAGRVVVRTRLVGEKQTFHERRLHVWDVTSGGLAPVAAPVAPSATADDAFAGAPNEVAGLVSGTVGMAVDRNFPGDGSELLVRGWYVPHDPLASCPGGLDQQIRPVLPPCNQGRNWLLDRPEQLWSDPIKLDLDRQPTGATLNPIIPPDVPFDVPRIWQGTSPTPLPVVVLGHFADPRVSAYAGDRYFVIDQLVWTGSTGAVPKSPVVRLTPGSTEAPEVVLERIEEELGPAITTWVSVMAPQDLAVLDPDAIERAPELGEGSAVWVVRRLIDEPYDNLTRRLVAWSFTTDGGTRIWHGAGSRVDLATTIDVDPPGGDTRIVEVVDYSRRVLSVRAATDGDHLRWQPVGPEAAGWRLEIATGSTSRELAVRWHANRCQTDWELHVRVDG
ncbi:MAG: hypothetical protein M3Q66_01065, partial [Chloroflexota bacterium]|nr:hypothetical protein [Chloroflexota bacterium]